MRIRDGSSDVCSSDLGVHRLQYRLGGGVAGRSAALPLVGLQPHQQVAAAAVGLDLGAVVAGGGQLLADVIDVGGAVEVHLDQRATGEVERVVETLEADRGERCYREQDCNGDRHPEQAHEVDVGAGRDEVEREEFHGDIDRKSTRM